jgi:hypothetical protein
MCPYVQKGRFKEALNTLNPKNQENLSENETQSNSEERPQKSTPLEAPFGSTPLEAPFGSTDSDWDLSQENISCIFAHQEFKGVQENGMKSETGDEWGPELPPVISGHIHTAQKIGKNIYYPGSPLQIAFDEPPDKHVWKITFLTNKPFKIEKLSLGIKGKKQIDMTMEKIKTFDFGLLNKYFIKIILSGTHEQFKLFRKSPLHDKLIRNGVKISFKPLNDTVTIHSEFDSTLQNRHVCFKTALQEIVKKKPSAIKTAYEELYPKQLTTKKIVSKKVSGEVPIKKSTKPSNQSEGCELVFIN